MSYANKDWFSIDSQIGRYIRKIRLINGLRQVELASIIGITFQQLQKYETGLNRLYIGRIIQICEALKMDLSNFFAGFKDFILQEKGVFVSENALKRQDSFFPVEQENPKEIIRLLEAYRNIKSSRIKNQITRLVCAISEIYTAKSD